MKRLQSTRRTSAIAAAFLLVASAYVAPRAVHACIPDPTLADFVREADAIAIVRILESREQQKSGDEGGLPAVYVTLGVETTLDERSKLPPVVGCLVRAFNLIGQTVDVGSDARMLAFLSHGEEIEEPTRDFYVTELRPLPDLATERVLTARVREMLDIAKIADEQARSEAYLEWCVRCIEEEATREDGVQSFPFGALQNDGEFPDAVRLTDGQLERIVGVFLSAPDLGEWGVYRLGYLLGSRPDARAIAHVENDLWRRVASDGQVDGPMVLLANMLSWPEGRQMGWEYERADADARQELLTEYLRLLPERVALAHSPIPEPVEEEGVDVTEETETEDVGEDEAVESDELEVLNDEETQAVGDADEVE